MAKREKGRVTRDGEGGRTTGERESGAVRRRRGEKTTLSELRESRQGVKKIRADGRPAPRRRVADVAIVGLQRLLNRTSLFAGNI